MLSKLKQARNKAAIGFSSAIFLAACQSAPVTTAPGSFKTSSTDYTATGYLEMVTIGDVNLPVVAKLDTGADTSSIHATDICQFKDANGTDKVHFRIVTETATTDLIERPLVRIAKIKGKGDNPSIERPVVELRFLFNDFEIETQVTLADRDRYSTNLLFGRNTLTEAKVFVNPGATYVLTSARGPS